MAEDQDARFRAMIEQQAAPWRLSVLEWSEGEAGELNGLPVPAGPVARLGRGRVTVDLPGILDAGDEGEITARVLDKYTAYEISPDVTHFTEPYVGFFIHPERLDDPMRVELGLVELL